MALKRPELTREDWERLSSMMRHHAPDLEGEIPQEVRAWFVRIAALHVGEILGQERFANSPPTPASSMGVLAKLMGGQLILPGDEDLPL